MNNIQRHNLIILLGWATLLILLSQAPYYMVWSGRATFPYDAYTTFSFWNVARLDALRNGEGLLGFFHTGIPSEVWPSYFFSGAIRQLFALFQVNSAAAHAMIQGLHLVVLVPLVAILFRSFGMPLRCGLVGGVVYALSGIHASLGQHVYSQEALVYLVASLLLIRVMVMGWPGRPARHNTILWLACALSLISLVRVHHEAVLYVIPLGAWTLGHIWLLRQKHGSHAATTSLAWLGIMSLVVAVCSVPMLLVAYDLSLTNKTQPYTYGDLQPYFPSFRIFAMGLLLPNFTGKLDAFHPFPYGFGQDSTLSYIFAGSFSAALMLVAIWGQAISGRWKRVLILAFSIFVLVAYTYGPGNPIHKAIHTVFPFLTSIGHGYYGLHLLYLLVAFGVTAGLHELVKGRGWREFICLQLALLAMVLYLALRAYVQGGWGLTGSIATFGEMLQHDTRWLANASLLAIAVVALATGLRRVDSTTTRTAAGVVMLFGMGGLVAVDMVRPAWGAHFMPGKGSELRMADPIAGFNLSTEVVEHFRAQAVEGEPLRVLPLFQKAGGWHSNALLPLNVALVSAPADSGGNLHITKLLSQEPSESVLGQLIDQYGVDAFWVARWGMDEWQEALAASPRLQLAFRSEYGGDVYTVRAGQTRGGPGFSWNRLEPAVSQGVVQRRWSFDAVASNDDGITLPMLWRPWYQVDSASGGRLAYESDERGRLRVATSSAGALVVKYPSDLMSILVAASALAYMAIVLLLLWLAAAELRYILKTRTGDG